MLSARLEELLQTIPGLAASSQSSNDATAVATFEAWLGISDDDGYATQTLATPSSISIDDEVPPDDFFASFAALIVWAYHIPIHPLQTEHDFQTLESIQVTRWLRYCMDLNIENYGSFAHKLLACADPDNSLLDAVYHHINYLAMLQSTQNTYTQSLRQQHTAIAGLKSRSQLLATTQSIADQLQAELDEHLTRLECIVGEIYSEGSVHVRILSRQYLATYWHAFVSHNSLIVGGGGGGAMHHENTQASGIAMTLRVLLRILKGSTSTLQKSHEHLLMYSLLPLHEPNALVLWRDQTSLLELYHEPLVQCMAVLLHKEPSWISPVLDRLLNNPIWTPSNTPKCILLLHEVDLILKMLPDDAEPLPAWMELFHKLTACMASHNSRLSERSLQFFRNSRFHQLFHANLEESLPIILKALVKPTELPWNPTVRKMIYHLLKDVHDHNEEAFAKACQVAFAGTSRRLAPAAVAAAAAPVAPVATSTTSALNVGTATDTTGTAIPSSANRGLSTLALTNKRASKVPEFSLKAGMGDWRPPKRNQNNGSMPPPSSSSPSLSSASRGRQPISSIGRGKAPWAAGSQQQPPLTVTGVAPWANTSSNLSSRQQQPPLTVTGIAPWSVLPNVQHEQQHEALPSTNSISEENSADNSVQYSNPALATVLRYMDDIKPASEEEGASTWSRLQMAESPTLLPSLKFHDLVFGHDLGSGAFGEVKYARRIDQTKTRSHWAEYAVKVISTKTIADMGYEASVQREIAVLRVMSHPGIARLISSFRFRDGAYLVLEYASRGDLHMLLRTHGSLDHTSTQFVIGEVVAALSSIHELGFVYGDLKTENTLITETGHIKLTDFGACRPYTEEAKKAIRKVSTNVLKELRDGDWRPTKHEEKVVDEPPVVDWNAAAAADDTADPVDDMDLDEEDFRIEGTISYLPPEVVLGSIPTTAADMWALGCVLYQCLTGRPPLLDDDDEKTRQKIVSFKHTSNGQHDALFGEDYAKSVHDDAKILIRKLLTRNSVQRPSCGEVAQDAFFGGKDIYMLYREAAHPLDVGTVAPVADAKWARRQLSSIWAPQPKAYDITPTYNDTQTDARNGFVEPIPEGEESRSFFSFTKRSGPLHRVKEQTEP